MVLSAETEIIDNAHRTNVLSIGRCVLDWLDCRPALGVAMMTLRDPNDRTPELTEFLNNVQFFDAKWFSLIGGDKARQELSELQDAEKRGRAAALVEVRTWAETQRKMWLESAKSPNGIMSIGGANAIDVLLEYLEAQS